jgi:hypothetical protein
VVEPFDHPDSNPEPQRHVRAGDGEHPRRTRCAAASCSGPAPARAASITIATTTRAAPATKREWEGGGRHGESIVVRARDVVPSRSASAAGCATRTRSPAGRGTPRPRSAPHSCCTGSRRRRRSRDRDRAAGVDGLAGRLRRGLARSYRLVRAAELVGAAGARQAGEPVPVALTFDDDLRSHVEHSGAGAGRATAPRRRRFVGGVSRPPWWETLQACARPGRGAAGRSRRCGRGPRRAALAREPRARAGSRRPSKGCRPGERDAIAASLDRFRDDVAPPLGPGRDPRARRCRLGDRLPHRPATTR